MKLLYKASTPDGKIIKGFIEAKGVTEAVAYLRSKDLVPIQVTSGGDKVVSSFLLILNKASKKDVLLFTTQLSSMISSGLNLIQALTILKEQVSNIQMKEIISSVLDDIEEGKSLSKALENYPSVFSPIYISLIRAAETSGLLDKVLLRIGENLEKQYKLKGAVKGALIYPIIIIIGMVVVMMIMMIFVVPQLAILYENLNLTLPLSTQIVVGISRGLLLFWPFILGLSVLLIFGIQRWYRTEAGRLILDDFKLRIPIIGVLIRQTILAEFTRTLGLLIGSGTAVILSLRQSADTTGNILYKNAINALSRRVEQGMSVGTAMMYSPLFPPILVQMTKIGEETGKVDESLTKLSEYFEREVDQSVKTLTTAMEPFFMVILGIGVAFLIISVITPIYNLTSSIQ